MKTALPKHYVPVHRDWINQAITSSPIWCAVDLRDGNQALSHPMTVQEKLDFFNLLVSIGFKEIEIGFPAASDQDWQFCRHLIDKGHIPQDVCVSVLAQCREHIISQTLEALKGIHKAICHIYIPSSELHCKFVLKQSWEELTAAVLASVRKIRNLADATPESSISLEFSPEEFTDSDPDKVAALCDKVIALWLDGNPNPESRVIINLPCTVERELPVHYPDMLEYAAKAMKNRTRAILSVHAHNDMGGAVAATEMALMTGAQRVEGTLFGHGERAGNVDLVTLALNLQYLGMSTGLDFSELAAISSKIARFTGMPLSPRHPYAGELAFASFAGSHQDAIHKVTEQMQEVTDYFGGWKMPYMHINPAVIGRSSQGTVRFTSQSGRGGIAHIMEEHYGIQLPDKLLSELYELVQRNADCLGRELLPEELWNLMLGEFNRQEYPIHLVNYWPRPDKNSPSLIHSEVHLNFFQKPVVLLADGDGPIAAFAEAIRKLNLPTFKLVDYEEKAMGDTVNAESITFVALTDASQEKHTYFGIGFGANIVQGAARAIVAALNRMME